MRNSMLEILKMYYESGITLNNYYDHVNLMVTYTDEQLINEFNEKSDVALFFENFLLECVSFKIFSKFVDKEDLFKYKNELSNNNRYPLFYLQAKYMDLNDRLADHFLSLNLDSVAIKYYKLVKELENISDEIKKIILSIDTNKLKDDSFIIVNALQKFANNYYNIYNDSMMEELKKEVNILSNDWNYSELEYVICCFLEGRVNAYSMMDEFGCLQIGILSDNINKLALDNENLKKLKRLITKYYVYNNYLQDSLVNISSYKR